MSQQCPATSAGYRCSLWICLNQTETLTGSATSSCLTDGLGLLSGSSGESVMTYVVVESCIKCKYMDCVEVCPVDCFYEGANMLIIHPDECIDCGVCEPECPVEAIKPDTEPSLEKFLKLNADFAKVWPNITTKK